MSNLLKDASILLTPTAYDNGRMLSIKPSKDLYGPEQADDSVISNTGGSIMTKVSALNYNATSDGTAGSTIRPRLLFNNTTLGKKYKITIKSTNRSGTILFKLFDGISYVINNNDLSSDINFSFVAKSSTTVNFNFDGTNVFNVDLEISLKEDLSGDFNFTRGSAATRVNAQGLVENVQILSSNLVQNGDFSEEGSEEVSNGSFSQEGVELITNGDFSDGSTGWQNTFDGEWVISGGKATLQVGADGSYLSAVGNILTTGKSYKAVITTSGGLDANNRVTIYANSNTGEVIKADGTHTLYFTANGTIFRFSGVANDNPISIDNVSVKEVGQDWTLGTGWSIGEDKAISIASGGGQGVVQDVNGQVFSGKTYKVEYTILDYVSGNVRPSFSGGGSTTGVTNDGNGTYVQYLTLIANNTSFNIKATGTDGGFNGSITNISVKEVGQDWNLGTGWSIGDGLALYDNSTISSISQSFTWEVGKTYKLTFDVSDFSINQRFDVYTGSTFIKNSSTDTDTSYTIYVTGDGGNILRFRGFVNESFSIDNISVIEITDDTNLPRINYEGFSYQDALGSEEIVNGDFSNGSTDWTLNDWTISNGKASLLNGSSFITQLNALEIGKTYKIQYTISDYDSGTIRWRSSGVNGSSNASNGVVTDYITAASTSFGIQGYNNFTGSISNISAKEYLGQEVVPDSGCGSWLLEPQSTNLVPYSEDFSIGNWTDNGVGTTPTITTGFLSPDGTNNATKISNPNNDSLLQWRSITPSGGTKSIYAKTTSGTGQLFLLGGTNTPEALFDVTENWQRFTLNDTDTTHIYAVDFRGASTLSEVVVWGAQVEALPHATSYIPTSGATSTRLQDIATDSGNSTLINSTEGTLYFEGSAISNDSEYRIALSNGTNQRISIGYDDANVRVYINNAGNLIWNTELPANVTDNNKLALKYKSGDYALWLNGVEIDTSNNIDTISAVSELNFTTNTATSSRFYGKVKAVAVFKEALTDAELTCLTTI